MNAVYQHTDRRIRRLAIVITVTVHLVAGGIAWLVYLKEPVTDLSQRVIEITLESPQPPQQSSLPQPSVSPPPPNMNRTTGHIAPVTPVFVVPAPAEAEALDDVAATEAPISTFRERISTDLLHSISQEEAFDSLMVLMDEYPEYKETIFRKMIAGKGMDRIPDLYVSTGILDLHMKMKFKSKYEYELMRQQFMYGAYEDPVLGPRGYQKTGLQVNVIELLNWVIGLVEGKKR